MGLTEQCINHCKAQQLTIRNLYNAIYLIIYFMQNYLSTAISSSSSNIVINR